VISVEPYLTYAKTAALNKAAHPTWEQIYIRGIACNWLVCVAVWVCARRVFKEETER
jgi:formate/nitrite transporter FocA (FNT family)